MLKITWLGQSGYLLFDGTTTICIDPYLSDCVGRIAGRPRTRPVPIEPEALKADAVICSHNHLDHLDVDAIPRMNKKMLFLAPSDCEKQLKELGVLRYRAFDEGANIDIGDFSLQAVYAKHSVPAVGIVAEHSGQKLYFTGDTEFDERLTKVSCDLLFICINGRLGNMNVSDAVRTADAIGPKTAVPNHYDMFASNSENPKKFTAKNAFIMEFNKEYEVKNGCLI